ncbi:hypothetical protein NESM_000356500 [Novymonas esmeraldas]|uniref:Uncharacterized protein n=1 Tax=Novymonas esmeraldas TaxID=1808958 RepID=A0AAW0ENH8_9TRYP
MAGATGMHSRPDAQTPASPHPTATGSHAGSSRLADTVATTHNHSTTANAVDAGAAAANSEWPPPPAQSERSASPNSVGARPRPRRHGSPFDDADSAATAAPAAHEEERLRAATATMSNDTRIFDPSAFPPPPADEEAVVAGTARQHTHHGLTGTLEPHRREGGATPALPSRDSNDPSYSDHHHHHNHHRGTSRSSHHSAGRRQQQQQQHAPRLVAHEESLAVRKPSALTRVERLRENLRGLQRQASSAVLQRRHSSAEMRAFGASYANLAGLASSAGATQHATTAGSGTNGGAYQHQPHHHSGRAHHHRHDSRPQRHRSPGQSRSTTFYGDGEGGDMEHSRHDMRRRHAERGRDSSAPYGSQNDDTALLEASASALGHAPHRREDAALTPLGAPGGNARDSWQDAPTRHYSADRVTLDQTSSDEDADRNRRHHTRHDGSASRSSSASSPSRSSSSSDYSQRSDSVLSSTASLVRFNDSFTTPITVHDAEGLHSFTLALEMFSRELRRVLYGFEEMVQSL